MKTKESTDYLTKQILTYIGNKRDLLSEIGYAVNLVRRKLGKEKLVTLDLFSGSGIVARLFKQYSKKVIANDLEPYSEIINRCFLSNAEDFDESLFNQYLGQINEAIAEKPVPGIVREYYSPRKDSHITVGDRAFYTNENAIYIDSFRHYLDLIVPEPYRVYFMAVLLIEASIHVNTCGVFKGFYKDKDTGIGRFGGKAENALARIKGRIAIVPPVLSNFITEYEVYREDANELVKRLPSIDLAYLDPPYNQHPYGSNYFMLNVILNNEIRGEISKVSGIPVGWNHSVYNKKAKALAGLEDVVKNLDARFVLVSYNNEGFITYDEMQTMLEKYGRVEVFSKRYNAFRGSRNLNARDLHTKEYLFLLERRH